MRVLVIGKQGQLAWELQRLIPAFWQTQFVGQNELNVAHSDAVAERIAHYNPEWVINCAAYTAVDKAESDTLNAYAINEWGVVYLAEACKKIGAKLVHVSTDFIFDGTQSWPYEPGHKANPLSVYGASKRAGEYQLLQRLPDQSILVRTSWVYSAHGHNFVKTMLRFMQEKPKLNIIADQIGSPTWAKGLAQWIVAVITQNVHSGIYHWSDAGVASWYDFAIAIQDLALQKNLLNHAIPILPITSADYPTPAQRPKYSVMDKRAAEQISGLNTVYWRHQLSAMLDELT